MYPIRFCSEFLLGNLRLRFLAEKTPKLTVLGHGPGVVTEHSSQYFHNHFGGTQHLEILINIIWCKTPKVPQFWAIVWCALSVGTTPKLFGQPRQANELGGGEGFCDLTNLPHFDHFCSFLDSFDFCLKFAVFLNSHFPS